MPDATDFVHQVDFEVRDYECDLQGVVNNAVYQNYLEHARHQFLLSRGVDFVEMSRTGRQLVLVKATLEYRRSLRPKDRFRVETTAQMDGRVRFVFRQRLMGPDGKLILEAKMEGTLVGPSGRPMASAELSAAICSEPESRSPSSAARDP